MDNSPALTYQSHFSAVACKQLLQIQTRAYTRKYQPAYLACMATPQHGPLMIRGFPWPPAITHINASNNFWENGTGFPGLAMLRVLFLQGPKYMRLLSAHDLKLCVFILVVENHDSLNCSLSQFHSAAIPTMLWH